MGMRMMLVLSLYCVVVSSLAEEARLPVAQQEAALGNELSAMEGRLGNLESNDLEMNSRVNDILAAQARDAQIAATAQANAARLAAESSTKLANAQARSGAKVPDKADTSVSVHVKQLAKSPKKPAAPLVPKRQATSKSTTHKQAPKLSAPKLPTAVVKALAQHPKIISRGAPVAKAFEKLSRQTPQHAAVKPSGSGKSPNVIASKPSAVLAKSLVRESTKSAQVPSAHVAWGHNFQKIRTLRQSLDMEIAEAKEALAAARKATNSSTALSHTANNFTASEMSEAKEFLDAARNATNSSATSTPSPMNFSASEMAEAKEFLAASRKAADAPTALASPLANANTLKISKTIRYAKPPGDDATRLRLKTGEPCTEELHPKGPGSGYLKACVVPEAKPDPASQLPTTIHNKTKGEDPALDASSLTPNVPQEEDDVHLVATPEQRQKQSPETLLWDKAVRAVSLPRPVLGEASRGSLAASEVLVPPLREPSAASQFLLAGRRVNKPSVAAQNAGRVAAHLSSPIQSGSMSKLLPLRHRAAPSATILRVYEGLGFE